jgi:hypothetical protein
MAYCHLLKITEIKATMDVTYTLNLDGKVEAGTCLTCSHFLSYRDEYQTHLDPWEYGSCLNPDVVDQTRQFGIYMTCSLHKTAHSQ